MIKKFHRYFEGRSSLAKTYYHGSAVDMPIGTVLVAGDKHKEDRRDFHRILEKYRPMNKLPHHSSLFMCDNEGDIDGEGIEYLFTIEALGPVSKHDRNWSSEVSKLHGEGSDEKEIKKAAENYWSGTPYKSGRSIWEYTTPEARVLSSEPY